MSRNGIGALVLDAIRRGSQASVASFLVTSRWNGIDTSEKEKKDRSR